MMMVDDLRPQHNRLRCARADFAEHHHLTIFSAMFYDPLSPQSFHYSGSNRSSAHDMLVT